MIRLDFVVCIINLVIFPHCLILPFHVIHVFLGDEGLDVLVFFLPFATSNPCFLVSTCRPRGRAGNRGRLRGDDGR